MQTQEGLAYLFLGWAPFLGFLAFWGFWWLLEFAYCGLLWNLLSFRVRPSGLGAPSDFWHFRGPVGFWVLDNGFGFTSAPIFVVFRSVWERFL